MMLKTVSAGIQVGVAAEIRQDEHGCLARVFGLALNFSPYLGTKAVRALDSLDVQGIGARVGNIHVVQSNPEQAGSVPPHQLASDINRKLIRAGQCEGVRHKIRNGKLQQARKLVKIDIVPVDLWREERGFIVVHQEMLVTGVAGGGEGLFQQPLRENNIGSIVRTE